MSRGDYNVHLNRPVAVHEPVPEPDWIAPRHFGACIYGLEITTGTSATTCDPHGLVTREQMSALLARFWRTAVAAGLQIP